MCLPRSVPHRETANVAFIWVRKQFVPLMHVLQRHLCAEMTGHQSTPHEPEATNCAISSELKQASSLPGSDSCSCMRYPYCFLIQTKCIFTLFSGQIYNLDLLSCEQRAPPSSAKSGRACDILQTCFTDDNVQCKI
jgi:hypothetical protein